MKKSIPALLLSAVLMLSLAGCGATASTAPSEAASTEATSG